MHNATFLIYTFFSLTFSISWIVRSQALYFNNNKRKSIQEASFCDLFYTAHTFLFFSSSCSWRNSSSISLNSPTSSQFCRNRVGVGVWSENIARADTKEKDLGSLADIGVSLFPVPHFFFSSPQCLLSLSACRTNCCPGCNARRRDKPRSLITSVCLLEPSKHGGVKGHLGPFFVLTWAFLQEAKQTTGRGTRGEGPSGWVCRG